MDIRNFNKLVTAFLIFPMLAHAAAYETYIDRRNPSNSQTIAMTVPVPIADAIYYYEKSTYMPKLALIGSGLTVSGGVISASGVPAYHTHDAADVVSGVFPSFLIPALEIWKINGLQTALDSKASAGGDVQWSQIKGITSSAYSEVGAAPAIHTHSASDVVSGVLSDARIPSLGVGKITGLQAILDGKETLGAAAAAQAFSIQRANHTGTQSADTLTDGTTYKAFTAAERLKLAGIAAGATVNSTDAQLRDRSTHTGTITASVVSDFNASVDARITGKFNTPTGTSSQYLDGTGTAKQFIQRLRVQTDASGNYTWTYPVGYPTGVVPVITAVSESASSTVPQGVQIVGTPTNTQATFKVINLPSTTVAGIVVLGAPVAAQAYIHITAIGP